MYADPTRLRQILFNLLSNAAKFTHGGHIRIRAWREIRPGGDVIHVDVSDTGIGMSPDQVKAVFDEFTQGDASTTRRYGGTGLGLTITLRFCRLMGGDVTARSTPGVGTTMSVTLPAKVTGPAAPR
jgi:signal transduction histidine kinase